MARTTIFPTQEILYDFLYMDMVPAASITPAPFTLEPGQNYAVQWGENLFENLSVIDAGNVIPGALAIGNGSGFELPGNNEPFGIAYFANDAGGEIVVFFLDGNVSQTITVYQGADTPIVLKDRTGTGIEYEGVEGVRVFDKDGNAHVFVPPVETEEKTVDLDFSGGAMEVTPTAGKLLSKVGIPVPANLLPENIAKDVDIAGVVGTHEGGGSGGDTLCPFIAFKVDNHRVTNTTATKTFTTNVTLKSHFQIQSAYLMYVSGGATYETSPKDIGMDTSRTQPDISESNGNITLSKTVSYTPASTSEKWMATVMIFATYTVPGMYVRKQGDKTVLYVDNTADVDNLTIYMNPAYEIDIIDFSDAVAKTSIYYAAFMRLPVKKVIFPPVLPEIKGRTFWDPNYNWNLPAERIADFSKATSIPKLNGDGNLGSATGLRILVPSALYDKWKTATYWTTYADCIEAV